MGTRWLFSPRREASGQPFHQIHVQHFGLFPHGPVTAIFQDVHFNILAERRHPARQFGRKHEVLISGDHHAGHGQTVIDAAHAMPIGLEIPV